MTTTPFVARETQVAALTAALARAAAGQPGAVLVGADAGVGKTRLLGHVAELAGRSGATAVTAHCVDLGEVGLPYLPFAEALTQLRSRAEVVDRVIAARPALGLLLPSDGDDGSARMEDQAGRLQLFDAIAAALAASGRPGAPLLLILEDLHWADSSSRDVLRFLVARMRAEHVLLVASYRTDDLHRRHPLRPMLAELSRHPRVERLDLSPFTPDEFRTFASAVTGAPVPEDLLRSVRERSEGNAYFAEELLEPGAAAAALPGSLSDVLRARLEQLDPAVQQLARVASVAGRRVSEPLLRAVAASGGPVDPDAFDAALREAVARNVLGGEDGRVAFRHALLAEAVYADLLPGEQTALHRAYRQVLTADAGLGSPAQLAHHAARSHDLPTALRASREAARDAAYVLAPAEELRHLETILRLWEAVPGAEQLLAEDRVAVLAAAALAASRAGLDERAVALTQEAVTASADEPARQAALRSRLARFLLTTDRDPEGFVEAARALADLPAGPPSAERAWALAVHAWAAVAVDRDDEAERSALAAIEQARSVGEPAAEADALATLAVLVVDDPERVADLLVRARDRAREAGDLVTELRCHLNLASTSYYAGLLDEAARLTEAGLARARESGLSWSVYAVQLRLFAELVRYARGDLSPPSSGVEAAPPSASASLAAVQLYAAVARGDADAVERGRALEPEWNRDAQVALLSGGCTIDALTWAGDTGAAVELALGLIEHMGGVWDDYFLGGIWLSALGLGALADAAHADRLAGREPHDSLGIGERLLERAVTTARRGRPRGGRLGPEGRAWLARARAEHGRLTGANDPELWAAAAAEFAYGYRYEQARTAWRWAQALLEAGDRDGARTQAQAAERAAREMGAGPLLDAVHALARRGRLDVPGARARVADLLTAREAEVLALVAHGLTNRQIGEQLFISGKTVSVHVSNVLAKLGASGRAEAVGIAHQRGLLADANG
ncbi:AAA family ATPase [Pengzhenrongella sicca]|uniref:AAA family ATPase n=2 Tax=Pengzhenrongella sicca TaxID=2819238 RepID=A0A8A4ZHE6_9MICO|nr:AAA family ATPase [Pengzhenrongella sicca]